MGVGARGGWAALVLCALLVLALLKAAVDSTGLHGSPDSEKLVTPGDNSANSTDTGSKPVSGSGVDSPQAPAARVPRALPAGNATAVTSSHMGASPNTNTNPNMSAPSQVPRTDAVSTSMPKTASRVTTREASTNTTFTTHVSHSVSHVPSTMSTAHNHSATSVSSPVTMTATINSKENPGSKFDVGSFLGGIVLTLGILSILYFGCKTYYSRRGIRYRTIDEHDAII